MMRNLSMLTLVGLIAAGCMNSQPGMNADADMDANSMSDEPIEDISMPSDGMDNENMVE